MFLARSLNRIEVSKMPMTVRGIKRTPTEQKKKWWELKKVLCYFQGELRQYLSGQEMLTDDWTSPLHVIRRKSTRCVFWKQSTMRNISI